MAMNTNYLKEALYLKLSADEWIQYYTNHNNTSAETGQTIEAVFESTPETAQTIPCVCFDLVTTEPLTKDDPTTNYYKSTVLLFCVTHEQKLTTLLADAVHSMFTCRPEGVANRGWFCDLSTDCITNFFTKFVNRLQLRSRGEYRQGQNVYNEDNDTYREAIQIEVIWVDYPCSKIKCEEVYEACSTNTLDDTFDPNCPCD